MIPFIYKKPKPKACDPLGQERGSCRDTELVAAEQRPALVPLLGLPAHLSAQWGKQSLLSLPPTRNNSPSQSFLCVFSTPGLLRGPSQPILKAHGATTGAGEAHGTPSAGTHAGFGAREMLQTQVGNLSSEKSQDTVVPTALPHLSSTATKPEHCRAEEFMSHQHPARPRASPCWTCHSNFCLEILAQPHSLPTRPHSPQQTNASILLPKFPPCPWCNVHTGRTLVMPQEL